MKRFAIFILCNLLTFFTYAGVIPYPGLRERLHATRKALCCCWTVWKKEVPCLNTVLITSVLCHIVRSPGITCVCTMLLTR